MGVGGALIMPSTLSILTDVFRDPRERGRAIGIWAAVAAAGVAVGPLLGGVLLKHFSWSSVFWVNVPIVVVAVAAGAYFVPESKDPSAPRLDPLGTVLSLVGLGSLLFAIIEGPGSGWSSTKVLTSFALGVVLVVAFVAWECHTDHPMLDISFFANPRFAAANSAVTLTFFAMYGSLFLMTQYWQFVDGYSPLEASVRLLPFAAALMLLAPLSTRLVERIGSKSVVTAGLLAISAGLSLMSTASTGSPYIVVISYMCIVGAGAGLVMAPATECVMGSLPREKAGVGSAVNDTTRQVGGALGIAIIGSMVANVYAAKIDVVADRFGLSGAELAKARGSLGGALQVAQAAGSSGNDLAAAAKDAFVSGLGRGVLVGGVAMLLAAFVAFRYLPARADDPLALDVEGHATDTIDQEEVTPGELAGATGS